MRSNLTRRKFLYGSLLATATFSPVTTLAKVPQNNVRRNNYFQDGVNLRSKTWSNWAGNMWSRPKNIYRPKTLENIQNIIKSSKKVRAIGTSHSFNAGAKTDETLVMTDKLNKVLEVDHARHLVKVQAGMKLWDLNHKLWKLGYCLPSLGDIDRQSVAGLVSTATHGTGIKWGTISDANTIFAIEIVTADGSLLTLSSDNPDDEQLLKAARVSMGLLGIVYSVTFKVEPKHNLHMVTKVVPLAEALDPALYEMHDHYEFFYFPYTGKAQQIIRNITDHYETRRTRLRRWWDEIFMENFILNLILSVRVIQPWKLPRTMKWLVRQLSPVNRVGKSYDIMTATRIVKFVESEFAIPIDKMPEAVKIYQDLVEEFADINHPHRFFCSFPFEVRFTKADEGAFLSPAGGRKTCYVSINLHRKFGGYEHFLREFNKRIDSLGARPHWGKLFYQNPLKYYPDKDKFLAVRAQLDPTEKFVNKLWNDWILPRKNS